MAVVLFIVGIVVGGVVAHMLAVARQHGSAVSHDAQVASLRAELERTHAEHGRAREALIAHHESLLRAAEEKVELVRSNREQLRDEMKAVSADVLKATGETLGREIAAQRKADQERALGELTQRTEQIKAIVEPIGVKIGQVETKVGRLEEERKKSEGQLGETLRALREGVGDLAAQAGSLSSALKRPSTRGSWGEIQLRNVIEMAGMVDHCDFTEQTTIHTDDGRLRPDVLVRLPGGKLVVVDSKVPLDAYLAHVEATDDTERDLHLARHAKQTRDHITKLASKGYQGQFDTTPELVVMFVPSDGIYHAALAADPALLEYGVGQQVLLATPTTLIGLLRAIHYGWRQELIAESAREIAEIGRELHKRLAIFAEPLAKVGRQLNSAVDAYNTAAGSFDRRVVPQLRRIEAAGAQSARAVPALAPVEETARALTTTMELEADAGAELAALEAESTSVIAASINGEDGTTATDGPEAD